MSVDLFPDVLPGCSIDLIERNEEGLTLQAHVNGMRATCPVCEQSSMCVHSSYVRSPQDLPIAEQAVLLAQQRGNVEVGTSVFDTKMWAYLAEI